MVLSHGQSVLVGNLFEKSIQCQRLVVDYMKSNGYNSYDVQIG